MPREDFVHWKLITANQPYRACDTGSSDEAKCDAGASDIEKPVRAPESASKGSIMTTVPPRLNLSLLPSSDTLCGTHACSGFD